MRRPTSTAPVAISSPKTSPLGPGGVESRGTVAVPVAEPLVQALPAGPEALISIVVGPGDEAVQ